MPPDLAAQTGASGTWGCAAVLGFQWCQWQWPPKWSGVGIMAKELIPIIFTCVAWGQSCQSTKLIFSATMQA